MKRCRRDDSIGHIRDAAAADTCQGLGNGDVHRNRDQGTGRRRKSTRDPREDSGGQTPLLFEVHDLNEGNGGHADAVGPLDAHECARCRREARVTEQRPNERVGVGHCDDHQISSRGKPAHNSRRASSISSAKGAGPRSAHKPTKPRDTVGAAKGSAAWMTTSTGPVRLSTGSSSSMCRGSENRPRTLRTCATLEVYFTTAVSAAPRRSRARERPPRTGTFDAGVPRRRHARDHSVGSPLPRESGTLSHSIISERTRFSACE